VIHSYFYSSSSQANVSHLYLLEVGNVTVYMQHIL